MISFIRVPCPICQNDPSERLFTDINRREGLSISATLVECAKCGMRYLNPAPNAASLAQLYSNGSVDTVALNPVTVQPVSRTLAPVSHLRSIVRSINGLLRGHPHDFPAGSGEGGSILDFGCFDGTKLVYWYQRGWRVAGIDLNQQALQVAQRRFPNGRFWCGDLLELDIAERFDFIRSDNVVEHLLDPKVVTLLNST